MRFNLPCRDVLKRGLTMNLSSNQNMAVNSQNPKGIPPQSPGLPSLRGYPGFNALHIDNPEGVAPGACGSTVHGKLQPARKAHWDHEPGLSPVSTHRAAFTITELLVAVTILTFVVGGVIAANLYGLRMFRISQTKLLASDGARRAIGKMADEIRNADSLYVGNLSNGTFYAIADGAIQAGTSLFINPTTNHSQFILYYINSADNTLRRTTSASNALVAARSITNNIAFSAQDCLGNILTNSVQDNRTFHVDLEFYRAKYQGVVADSFKLESSITRRLK